MPDVDWLLYELGGKHRAQVLSTLAALGVVDALVELGPSSTAALAARLGCDEADLDSLMRAGAGLEVLREDPPGTFLPTERGLQLQQSRLGAFAAFLGSPPQWQPWARLRDAVRAPGGCEARPPFAHTFGRSLYEYLAQNPAAAAEYDAAIDAFTRHEAELLLGSSELCKHLSECGVLVDVGGGRGTLLQTLLPACRPGARGLLLDLPHVVARCASDLPDSIEGVAGDFLEDVPSGGDAYLVKHVLHNWRDEDALRILQHCRQRKAEGGLVLVLDAVLAPDNRPDLARMLDLEMRVLCGGRERRKPEVRRLLTRAGLSLQDTISLPGGSGCCAFVAR